MAHRTTQRPHAALLLAALSGQACAESSLPVGFFPTLAGALLVLGLGLQLARRIRAGRGARLGRYTLGEQVGAGNMGAVYRARSASLGQVAIKVLHAERASARDRARFAREVELTRRLAHPNIVAVLDSGSGDDGAPYCVMEYLDGVDLQTLVEREGPLSAARTIEILRQLSSALARAHALGVVHRDVKPANIMICAPGSASERVKLVDFGLAQLHGAKDLLANDADTISGTPLYLAPEAITTPDAIDPRTDLYALGAVGYFLLTGQHVFSGRTLIELCSKHLYEVPLAPSQRTDGAIPEALEALLLACLAKAPSARPASAETLHSALRACSGDGPSELAVRSVERASEIDLEPFAATVSSSQVACEVIRVHAARWNAHLDRLQAFVEQVQAA
jgi:eukaryotic-like serine/threonine-protein kinase